MCNGGSCCPVWEEQDKRGLGSLQSAITRWKTHRRPNTLKDHLIYRLKYEFLPKSLTNNKRIKKSRISKIRIGIYNEMHKDLGSNYAGDEIPVNEIDPLIYNGSIIELLTC